MSDDFFIDNFKCLTIVIVFRQNSSQKLQFHILTKLIYCKLFDINWSLIIFEAIHGTAYILRKKMFFTIFIKMYLMFNVYILIVSNLSYDDCI